MAANRISTPTRIRPAMAPSMCGSFPSVQASLDDFLNHRGGTVDMHDGDMVARFVDIVVVEWPRRPDLAVELHLTFVATHPVQHQRTLALELLRPVQQPGARIETAPQCGPHQ